MKTSTKMLIGTFILILCSMLFLHLSLYGKYKSHIYETEEQLISSSFTLQTLPLIHYVNLNSVRAYVRPANQSRLGIKNQSGPEIAFHIIKDSLFVEGNADYKDKMEYTSDAILNRVQLWLPDNISINATNSQVQIKGAVDTLTAESFKIKLDGANLVVGDFLFVDSSKSFFKKLAVSGNNQSNIVLNSQIDDLDVNLFKTSLSDWGAKINSIKVRTDDSSTLSLNGRNFPQCSNK